MFHGLTNEIYFRSINCTKFGQSTSGKSLKLLPPDVTILRRKCTKFDFGWGFAPDPAGRAYKLQSSPQPLAGFQGPTSKGKKGNERDGRGRERGEEDTGW